MRIVQFNQEESNIEDFINLPKKIYSEKINTEDEDKIRDLLTNNHILSIYFKLNKFLIYQKGNVVGRFVITEYHDDKDTCYLGFFECINDEEVSKFIFDEVNKFAKENNYKKIIGPVDASFWIKYRLKTNLFDKLPYTGEPYNVDYYYDMFINNGYKVIERYTSNIYNKDNSTYSVEDYSEEYNRIIKKGYKIVKPRIIEEFDRSLDDIYYLIRESYSKSPVFKELEKDDFINLFKSYEKIINLNMIRIVYYKDKVVGFCISIPNYGTKIYNSKFLDKISNMWTKNKPKEYIIQYLEDSNEHKGLAKAISYSIAEELKKINTPSINAIVKDDLNTQHENDNQYEYVLLEKIIKE